MGLQRIRQDWVIFMSRKNEAAGPKQKLCSVMDLSGVKVKWCKKQYCTRTWNVRSMNQGKLNMVKQEIARVNINILEISKLKWMGMSEFNSDDYYIYYCGQEYLRRNGVDLMVDKMVWNAWVQSQKRQNNLGSFLRQTIQHHSNPSLCPNH